MTTKITLLLAAINGFVAVCLGAFGAHGLRNKLSESLMSAYTTAVQYHFYHTFALLAVAILIQQFGSKSALQISAVAFVVGIVLFCGSLYGLALGAPNWLGPITPLGGLAFIAGWLTLIWFAVQLASQPG